MPSFIEDIILFFLVIYIFKSIVRSLLPFLFKTQNSRFFRNSNSSNSSNNYQANQPSGNTDSHRPEGRLQVDYIPPKKERKGRSFEGEFVDYEEVKK